MANHVVFETTNMAAVKYAKRIFDAAYETDDIDNGTFGYLDGLAEGQSVIYNFALGTKSGTGVVVANMPAWRYEEYTLTDQRRDNYYIEAGMPFRAYTLDVDDEFGISIEGFTVDSRTLVSSTTDFTDTDVYVTIDSSTGKLAASTTADTSAVFQGRIMRKRVTGATLSTPLRNYGSTKEIYEVKVTALN